MNLIYYKLLIVNILFLIGSSLQFDKCSGQSKLSANDNSVDYGSKISLAVVPIYENGDTPCESCECNLSNLLSSWNTRNISNINTLRPLSFKLVDTLTNAADLQYYLKKISYDNKYYIFYDGNTKIVNVKQRKNLTSQADKKALEYLRNEALSKLTLNNTIYEIKVKLEDGTVFYDFAICDTKSKKISFDNLFYYLWLMK